MYVLLNYRLLQHLGTVWHSFLQGCSRSMEKYVEIDGIDLIMP